MNVFLLLAEHFSVPGQVQKVFVSLDAAEAEGVELTNTMLQDNGRSKSATTSNWRSKLEELQEEHGENDCYIEINETELIGANLL